MYGIGVVAPPRGPSHPEAEGLFTETAAQAVGSEQTDSHPYTAYQQPPTPASVHSTQRADFQPPVQQPCASQLWRGRHGVIKGNL